MTGKTFSRTPCIGEVGSYHAHEGCEYVSGLPYQMSGYTLCRGTSGLRSQRSACISGGEQGSTCRRTLFHRTDKDS